MSASLTLPAEAGSAHAGRGVYCNRTLNLRAVRAIGFDMDYTLVHYNVEAWEQRAYDYLQQRLAEEGWPVGDLRFSPAFAMRGLIIDTTLGNIVKADRFGYVKRAYHGTRRLDFEQQRTSYTRQLVDLADRRWLALNTFFSLSEATMYAQLVDRMDAGHLPHVMAYDALWERVHAALDATHAEGRLKAEIVQDPTRYVDPDAEIALALLDLRESGKKLLLITNSEWPYTRAMMSFCFDRFLPVGTTWRDLFELTIVSARKPEFFTSGGPLLSIVSEEGLLEPCVGPPAHRGVYFGGTAPLVEQYLKLSGAEILYVGDHVYTDVRVSKDVRRWRTGLIVRELEGEVAAVHAHRAQQQRLDALMAEKTAIEREQALLRLSAQRQQRRYAPAPPISEPESKLARLRGQIEKLDAEIGPLAVELGSLYNETWGPIMHAGQDPSFWAGQLENYADIYTSRVSNFLGVTPFAYLRAPRSSMPHDLE
ncbi:MAG: HAD-IG family 5'-nucleotidase [Vicinamibacterales bacterium]